MKSTWTLAFEHLLESEGGFTDDPLDNGNKLPDGRPGCTNLGITQAVWEQHVKRQVTHEEMKALTPDDVNPLYKTNYWDSVRGDDLPLGIDYLVFDMAVNSGPKRAIMTLQKCVGANPDGAIGPKTLAAVSNANLDTLIDDYTTARLEFMKSLPSWGRFGVGWERRVNEVAKLADQLSQA